MSRATEHIEDLIKVQEEIKNPANTAVNPFFASKYAPLPDILNEVRPILLKHGFVLIQDVGGDPEGKTISIQTALLHKTGFKVISDKLHLKIMKGGDPQKAGAAITYGRRFQLCALLGIAGEEDNDANDAKEESKPKTSENREKKQVKKAPKQEPKKESKKAPKTEEPDTKAPKKPRRTIKGTSYANPEEFGKDIPKAPKKTPKKFVNHDKVLTVKPAILKKIFRVSPELEKIFSPVIDSGNPVPQVHLLKKAYDLAGDDDYPNMDEEKYQLIKTLIKGN